MTSTSNNNLQLPAQAFNFLRRPVEIMMGKDCEPVPVKFCTPADGNANCPIRQAFANLAELPEHVINYDECDNDFSFNDSNAEILLTDSEDEDDFGGINDVEADTAIDSADLEDLSDGDFSDMDVFDEAPIAHDNRLILMEADDEKIQTASNKASKRE